MPRIVVKPVGKTVSFRNVKEHRRLCIDKKMNQFASDNVDRLSETLLMFNECFTIIKVRISSRDPPYICAKSGRRTHGVTDSLKAMSCKSESTNSFALNKSVL